MVLNILMALALLTVLATLALGMINLGKNDVEARLRSNRLMRMRVFAQAIAVGILAIALYLKSQSGA